MAKVKTIEQKARVMKGKLAEQKEIGRRLDIGGSSAELGGNCKG